MRLLAVALASLIPLAASAQETSPWADMARTDIDSAYVFIERVHAGPVDDENPRFRANMDRARVDAHELAGRAESFEGYRFALMAFADAFEDGHMNVRFRIDARRRAWPGFIALRRGSKVVVASADGEMTDLLGAEISRCDEKPLMEVLRTEVLPYRGVGEIDGSIARAAPYLFLYEANPFASLPRTCDFRVPGGNMVSRDLDWNRIDAAAWSDRLEAARGSSSNSVSLAEYAPSRFWISLPSFLPQGKNVAVFESVLGGIESRLVELRAASSIVFDVRGNSGGNSRWGARTAFGLWGEPYVRSRMPLEPERVYWRVSDVALARMDDLIERDKRNGLPENVAFYERVKAGLLETRGRGEELWYSGSRSTAPEEARPAVANPVAAPVFVLIDEGCRSACLDFLDLLRPLDNVTFVGSPSYADAIYNESISRRLPSGAATLNATIKVIRGRQRGHNEPYLPDIPYEGSDWSQGALQAWIAELAAAAN